MEIRATLQNPVRLDLFLVRNLPGISRRRARLLVASDFVRLNGRKTRKGDLVRSNDVVWLARTSLLDPPDLVRRADLPVRVLHEDDALVAIDKPAGMPTHALHAEDCETVANFLLARYPEMRHLGRNPLEAGLVHRLDTGTSGVLLAARTPGSYRKLRRMFSEREVNKLYITIVSGEVLRSQRVEVPIAHQPRNKRRMCACPSPERAHALQARAAVTSFRPLRRFSGATLLMVKIVTGVRHQIRVHLSAIGHPVLGDPLYSPTHRAEPISCERPLLHAARVRLRHPRGQDMFAVDAPLPEDFLRALESLEPRVGN